MLHHDCVFSVAVLTCMEKPLLSISVAKPPSTTFTSAAMISPETAVLASSDLVYVPETASSDLVLYLVY